MRKRVFLTLGWMCVGLGFIGVFVPMMPTTPFLLLALLLFAQSSPSLRITLMRNRFLGPYIRGYASKRGMPAKSKFRTLLLMWVMMISSMVFILPDWWSRGGLVVIGLGVTIHILMKKTDRSGRSK